MLWLRIFCTVVAGGPEWPQWGPGSSRRVAENTLRQPVPRLLCIRGCLHFKCVMCVVTLVCVLWTVTLVVSSLCGLFILWHLAQMQFRACVVHILFAVAAACLSRLQVINCVGLFVFGMSARC